MRAHSTLTLALVLVAGCTFGGLDYPVETCKGAEKQSEDLCDRLNKSEPDSCTPFQCDGAKGTCVRAPRDDDRDGDPSSKCGGTDCDETDKGRSGKKPEVCSGDTAVDENCDGQVDENLVKPGTSRPAQVLGAGAQEPWIVDGSPSVATFVAPSTGGSCIKAVRLDTTQDSGFAVTGCAALRDDPSLVPHQPYARLIGGAVGTVLVATSGCTQGKLLYRYGTNGPTTEPGAELACGTGVALPAFAAFPQGVDGLAVFYDVKYADRDDPVARCAAALPAPLLIARITNLPTPSLGTPIRIADESTGTRPPAVAGLPAAGAIVIAAPFKEDAALWTFTPNEQPVAPVLPAARVAGLAGARATAIAIADDGAFALAAEIGCSPATPGNIKVAFGTIDPATRKVTIATVADVASGGLATQPSVALLNKGGQWLVSFIATGPEIRTRRFTRDGKAIGEAITAGRARLGSINGGGSSGGTVFAFEGDSTNAQFVQIPLACQN